MHNLSAPFSIPVAVTTKFFSAGALVFCSRAPVVAERKTRHLLKKFSQSNRAGNSWKYRAAPLPSFSHFRSLRFVAGRGRKINTVEKHF
jgi:hypothetical protein